MAFYILGHDNISFRNQGVVILALGILELMMALNRCLGKSSTVRCISHVQTWQQRADIWIEKAVFSMLYLNPVKLLHPPKLKLQSFRLGVIIFELR